MNSYQTKFFFAGVPKEAELVIRFSRKEHRGYLRTKISGVQRLIYFSFAIHEKQRRTKLSCLPSGELT